MNDQPRISKVAFGVGAATLLLALVRIVWALLQAPLVVFVGAPLVAAGIALLARSLRGSLRWPRALAAWAGGFLVGAPVILMTPILSGPGDSTFWFMNVIFTAVCLFLGTRLIKIGFKR